MTESKREYFREYRRKHRDLLKAYNHAYWQKNKDRYNGAKRVKYYQEVTKCHVRSEKER